jgi:hypothetical protein
MLRTDQIAELQIMLEDHGAPVVLEELANACADRAAWLNDNAPQIYANTAALYAKQAYLIRKLATSYAIYGELTNASQSIVHYQVHD